MSGLRERYLEKLKGTAEAPPGPGRWEVLWSWVGALLGMSAVVSLNNLSATGGSPWVIGSFGASAVLIYGAVNSPLAQPRNLIGGHVVSALVGVTCQTLLPDLPEIAAPLAVATAIAAMQLTRTLHPPGGATALIAVIGGPEIHALGYGYVLLPTAGGALVLLLVAVIFNNLVEDRRYPDFWW